MTPRLLRKAALLIGATAVAGSALAATPAPAFADTSIQPVVISVLPYCVQASDSPGRSAQFCVNSISQTSVPGTTTSEAVTANGSVTVCTSAWSCTTAPLVLSQTGVGLNTAGAVPTITPTGSTSIGLTVFCVGGTCTPSSVSVPTYQISLFPPGSGPAAKVCVDGICSASPLAPVVISSATAGAVVAALAAS